MTGEFYLAVAMLCGFSGTFCVKIVLGALAIRMKQKAFGCIMLGTLPISAMFLGFAYQSLKSLIGGC